MKKDKDNVGTAAIESALTSQTILNNLQNGASEKFVSEDDYLKLSRLVIEHTFRADNGLSNTLDELYADNGELILPAQNCMDVRLFANGDSESLKMRHGVSFVTSVEICALFLPVLIPQKVLWF
jgi:hypothetical protein